MVFEKLRALLAEQLMLDPEEITMDTDILQDLGADSLDVMEVMMGMEEAFNLVIVDESLDELHTVRDVVAFIEGLLKK